MFNSIRGKILTGILTFLVLVSLTFAIYELNAARYYKNLRHDGVVSMVEFEAEKVNKLIIEMERNAIDLANSGQVFFAADHRSRASAEKVVLDNFRRFPRSVGGGLWFEPGLVEPGQERWCVYACYDREGRLAIDNSFESENYDYHNQSWYSRIHGYLAENRESRWDRPEAVWSAPYRDETGTLSWMSTVGAGIYSVSGELIGISTVDWLIQEMENELVRIKPTPGSFVILWDMINRAVLVDTSTMLGNSDAPVVIRAWRDSVLPLRSGGILEGNARTDGVEYLTLTKHLDNDMMLRLLIPERELFAEIDRNNNLFLMVLGGSALVLIALTLYALFRYVTRPLKMLTASAEELAAGDLNVHFTDTANDEFGLVGRTFNRTLDNLKLHIARLADETAARERLSSELEVAAQIQKDLLPGTFPPFPERGEFDIYAEMHPAKEVGGDFYDFFLVDGRRLGLVIADVSGKGIPAALFMMIARTILRNNALGGLAADEVLFRTNNSLCENNQAGMFVTVFIAILDLATGELEYANAGHNPPVLLRGDAAEPLPVKPGFVLGACEDMQFTRQSIRLESGDELFCYTDGVTEAMTCSGELFGAARMTAALRAGAGKAGVIELTHSVNAAIRRFAAGAEQADDITILTLRFRRISDA